MGKEKMYYEQLGYDFDPPFYMAKDKPVATNADRIRAMSDEELSKQLWNIRNAERCVISDQKRCIMFDDCIACWLDWLRQEAK